MELKYLDRAELCAEAQAVVRRVYSEMSGKSDFISLCEHIDRGGSFTELRQMIDECAEKHGQNVYELRNTVYMASLESARKNYIKNGIEEMFFEGLSDFGTKTEVVIGHGYPTVVNSEELTELARALAAERYEAVELDRRYTAEDFGFYTVQYPSLFYRLGVGSAAGRSHTSTFAPDERAIDVGINFMSELVSKVN